MNPLSGSKIDIGLFNLVALARVNNELVQSDSNFFFLIVNYKVCIRSLSSLSLTVYSLAKTSRYGKAFPIIVYTKIENMPEIQRAQFFSKRKTYFVIIK